MKTTPQVFVVDDDQAVRKSICALLRTQGLSAVPYSSAVEFLKHEEGCHVGVVIADLSMPGMTGAELQQHLLNKGSPLAVIVVTGVAEVSDAVQVMSAGAITLLEKPFLDEDLIVAVRLGLSTRPKTIPCFPVGRAVESCSSIGGRFRVGGGRFA